MPPGPSSNKPHAECEIPSAAWAQTGRSGGSVWSTAASERLDAKSRLARLAQALESDVIPRLVGAHGQAAIAPAPLKASDIEAFVAQLRSAGDAEVSATVTALHQSGLSVEVIFLELFAPAARRLGELWVSDECDFASVTICLGRLQRLLREWSRSFGNEVEHPANGRRILLAQHAHEQHSFGLSMVAEFFRREGWEVLGGIAGAVADPSLQVSREWFDVVGFSVGSESRLDWLRERIAHVRAASLNRSVVVLVGGPVFVLNPDWVKSAGADATGHEGGKAPQLAEELLSARIERR
jgi:MerR family transcriptional regulator, light-induced transcriptional regulator